jgi:putative tryptophan/tyrosine transport system substrate-binding protein
MRRREFIAGLGGAVLLPAAPRAKRSDKTYRIGWLNPIPIPEVWISAFRQGLQDFNYVERKNLIIEYRWGDGDFDRLPRMAAELVRLNPDVIVSANTAALLALQKETQTIPIVMMGPGDPLAVGIVNSLARPGGNITGVSQIAPELSGKRLELFKEAVPKLARVTVLSNPGNAAVVLSLQETRAAAKMLDLSLDSIDVREPREFARAFSAVVEKRPDGLVLLLDSMILSERTSLAEFALEHRLPSISPFREFTEAGGLLDYGVSVPDIHRRAAIFIDKILRGAKPNELPVEQPVKFELGINLETAKAIGLSIPEIFLVRADQVIEK